MRQRLAPMLYDDTDKDAAEALRASVVAKAERSPAAVAKQTTGRTEDGLPVQASAPCSPTSPPSRETPWSPPSRPSNPSPSPHGRHPSSKRPATSSPSPVPSRRLRTRVIATQDQ